MDTFPQCESGISQSNPDTGFPALKEIRHAFSSSARNNNTDRVNPDGNESESVFPEKLGKNVGYNKQPLIGEHLIKPHV